MAASTSSVGLPRAARPRLDTPLPSVVPMFEAPCATAPAAFLAASQAPEKFPDARALAPAARLEPAPLAAFIRWPPAAFRVSMAMPPIWEARSMMPFPPSGVPVSGLIPKVLANMANRPFGLPSPDVVALAGSKTGSLAPMMALTGLPPSAALMELSRVVV